MVAAPVEQVAPPLSSAERLRRHPPTIPALLAGLAFVILFATPFRSLVTQWWNDPDAGHGLLLFPVALWLAWREGIDPDARREVKWGAAMIVMAVLARALGSAAAELFT
ncbi:MAG: archaeosortase/exosortase family protein, partial [Gemmatimonadota bacterium]